jgi:DNA-directed RNA polymerase subunit RPC12/RpoP
MIIQFNSEYKCIQCGHNFSKTPWMDENIQCSRCCSDQIEHNPYLLGTSSAEGLTAEDYYAVALKP